MIEFRHFQTLVALAETGSVAKAAKRLHLTQSALSHQLRALEDEYANQLFERKTSPLRWTPVGERLLELAYDAQKLINDAHRDIATLIEGKSGELRIAVECHSCFDWLMPTMDAFRDRWQQVEQDLVSGFHPDPVDLLEENLADVVIISSRKPRAGIVYHPLFSYKMPALLAHDHPLARKSHLTARDFANETLITYPIPDEQLDLMRQVLAPAGVNPARRHATLTIAILQLVAGGRGIAALPRWAVQPYLDRDYVVERPITRNGLACRLWAATTTGKSRAAYMREFIALVRETSFRDLDGIEAFV